MVDVSLAIGLIGGITRSSSTLILSSLTLVTITKKSRHKLILGKNDVSDFFSETFM